MAVDYGSDLDWGEDLEPNGFLVTGMLLLGQAAFHAIFTPRGSCLDSPERGIDVRDFLHQGMSDAERAEVPGQIRGEILEDPRFADVEAVITETPTVDGLKWDLRIIITPVDSGPFELVCDVVDAIPRIVSITAVA